MKVLATVAIGVCACGCAAHRATLSAAPDNTSAVVEIRPLPHETLRDQIIREAAVAEAHGLAPFLELTSQESRRCFLVDHSFDDPGMRQALAGTYIIRVDMSRWVGRFGSTGLDRLPMALPGFVELAQGGRSTGPYIDARSWAADAPGTVAPSLSAFVHSVAER